MVIAQLGKLIEGCVTCQMDYLVPLGRQVEPCVQGMEESAVFDAHMGTGKVYELGAPLFTMTIAGQAVC
jgi:hypothetical protein